MAVAACAVGVGTMCSGRHGWSAATAVFTGAATCCVMNARSQNGSMCVSEGEPHLGTNEEHCVTGAPFQPFALISVQG